MSMSIAVELTKRARRTPAGKKQQFRYHLRWRDETGKRYSESTGTGDKTQAEALRVQRWNELNGLAPKPATKAAVPVASWDDCRAYLSRVMTASGLRPSYVGDALAKLSNLQSMFPDSLGPAQITPALALEYMLRKSEAGLSPHTIAGDLGTIKAAYSKLAAKSCGLLPLDCKPFAEVKAPAADQLNPRIILPAEQADLLAWFSERWNGWQLPLTYLSVAAELGWRATEIASLRDSDLLADGFVQVRAANNKTRDHKVGWLNPQQYAELQACAAGGFAFGRFSDELRRLLMLWKRSPNHAERVRDFAPQRLVGWMQKELQRYNAKQVKAVAAARAAKQSVPDWEPITLHDFRRSAITALQMAGVSENDCSLMVGAGAAVIRKHYRKLDALAIAKRNGELRQRSEGRFGAG